VTPAALLTVTLADMLLLLTMMMMMMMMVMMLSGENVAEDDSVLRSQLAKTEISLTLSNKHELPDSDDVDKTRLLLRSVPSVCTDRHANR